MIRFVSFAPSASGWVVEAPEPRNTTLVIEETRRAGMSMRDAPG